MAKAEVVGVRLTLTWDEAIYLRMLTGSMSDTTARGVAGDIGPAANKAIYTVLDNADVAKRED